MTNKRDAEYIRQLEEENARLRIHAEFYASCPCCDGITECNAECTFSEDCPGDVWAMKSARFALNGFEVGE